MAGLGGTHFQPELLLPKIEGDEELRRELQDMSCIILCGHVKLGWATMRVSSPGDVLTPLDSGARRPVAVFAFCAGTQRRERVSGCLHVGYC